MDETIKVEREREGERGVYFEINDSSRMASVNIDPRRMGLFAF